MAPFFDGWYQNPDGTATLSFGYSNLNREEVEIPVGPDNVVTPKEYDGRQPTAFLPGVPDATDAAAAGRRQRERGVFTVTVPAGFSGDVVWTLRYRGQTYSVPGRAKNSAYQLDWPMAMGSVPPLLRFTRGRAGGPGSDGHSGKPRADGRGQAALSRCVGHRRQRERKGSGDRSGQARASRDERELVQALRSRAGRLQPAAIRRCAQLAGTANTSVTFKEPGEYVLRVRVDNFGRLDTSPGNQCCWTNGYVKVTVTP